jgi:hypothetical protein
MKQRPAPSRKQAEELAIQALTFIAGDAERLGRFLAITGIGPGEIRSAAREPGFLVGLLDYMTSDDRLVARFATENSLDPSDVERSRAALGGGSWEREDP